MSNMQILWKKIESTNYYISNYGEVKNKRGLILKTFTVHNRYCIARICINGKYKTSLVHRLVASAFIPNPNNLTTVNHKDGNKHNNNVDNLEWSTQKDNIRHAWENVLAKKEIVKSGTCLY